MAISGHISPQGNIGGSINGIGSISGSIGRGMGASGFIISDTTANWANKTTLVSKKNVIYVYTDYAQDDQGRDIPAIKIGDGLAYVVDLPFVDELFYDHIYNTDIHVTLLDKLFWNNKNRAYVDDDELILTTE